jgi:hypothetical protein
MRSGVPAFLYSAKPGLPVRPSSSPTYGTHPLAPQRRLCRSKPPPVWPAPDMPRPAQYTDYYAHSVCMRSCCVRSGERTEAAWCASWEEAPARGVAPACCTRRSRAPAACARADMAGAGSCTLARPSAWKAPVRVATIRSPVHPWLATGVRGVRTGGGGANEGRGGGLLGRGCSGPPKLEEPRGAACAW